MASISAPTPPPRNLIFQSSHRHPKRRRSSLSPSPPFPSSSRFSDSHLCRCTNSSSSSSSDNQGWRWDAVIQDVFKSAIKTFDSYFGKRPWDGLDNGDFVETASRERRDEQRGAQEWDWDRWKKHFEDIDDQERLVSVLKSQLRTAVNSEDYEDASRIKVAIAAATTSDTVGEVMRNLLKAVAEERYQEAAFLRDHAGAGLVGWWSGISDEVCDPHGLIIRITAEHGRYVARSYSPRQLATATAGVPLFEIFFIMNKKGEYKQQAVYLKRKKQPQDPSMLSSIASSSLSRTGPTEEKDDLFVVTADETEDDDDTEDGFDPVDGFPGFNNIFRDMIPGVKVKVLKVTTPSKMDRDFIAKVIDDLEDEEDEDEEDEEEEDEEEEDEEEEDEEEEDEDDEDESSEGEDDIKGESEEERDEIDVDAASEMIDNVGHGEISIKVMLGGLAQKSSPSVRGEDRVRVPAKLERKGRTSFCLSIEKETKRQDAGAKELASAEKQGKLQGQRSLDQVMLDLAKFIGKEKIPLKVLKDLSELLSVSLSQAQNRQPLSGSTTFHRIDASASPDPLSGLYIGARGLYTSEVIHLQRKVGQWQDNSGSNSKEASRLEFYEYVEAVKLTGDPYVPAGEVAFRAKVGKRYQLPHKGIIPEEFGVIARYKGQGRLADPGFGNPRWVDGELVILDGKYVKGGPIIGFVYWAPEYHFLVFFNRLRLP